MKCIGSTHEGILIHGIEFVAQWSSGGALTLQSSVVLDTFEEFEELITKITSAAPTDNGEEYQQQAQASTAEHSQAMTAAEEDHNDAEVAPEPEPPQLDFSMFERFTKYQEMVRYLLSVGYGDYEMIRTVCEDISQVGTCPILAKPGAMDKVLLACRALQVAGSI